MENISSVTLRRYVFIDYSDSQSIITLTFKSTGETYVFGSISAIYSMFTPSQLGITYSALRNAVSKYIKDNKVDENGLSSQIIYNTRNSMIILRRAPLLLAEKSEN